MIPKQVYDLCQSGRSVASELASNPKLAPHEACKKLYGLDIEDQVVTKKLDLSKEEAGDLEQARNCGNWGNSNPSDLFLRVSRTVRARVDEMSNRLARSITMCYAR